jgi:hypothetical protein
MGIPCEAIESACDDAGREAHSMIIRGSMVAMVFALPAVMATAEEARGAPPEILVSRCAANPLITPQSSPSLGENTCGPSVIRAPDWLPNRLGRYYMYFAHHKGSFLVFYSRIGDAPERILVSILTIADDWRQSVASAPGEVLAPETDYEGIEFAIAPSEGDRVEGARQLRDPAVFQDEGKTCLFYSIAGEIGIAVVEITLLEPHPQVQADVVDVHLEAG